MEYRVIIVFALLIIITFLIFDLPFFRWKRHFAIMEGLDKKEKIYRAMRQGDVLPRNNFEKEIVAMREYDFERYIWKMYSDYEGGDLVAESRWNAYLNGTRFKRIAPSPIGEEKVIYWENREFSEI